MSTAQPRVRLFNGDSLEILTPERFRDENDKMMSRDGSSSNPWRGVDAVVADPPYGFDFAGSDEWDSFQHTSKVKSREEDALQFAKFTKDWSSLLRPDKSNILKPGAHALVFSADRTIDLVGLGLRQAQYDIVRLMFWLYSTGQVKNKTDLRPGCEPICVVRTPYDGSLTALHKKEGLGQLNAQVWKQEDGRHPTNMLIDDSLYMLDEELAEMVRKAKAPFFAHKSNANARLDRDWGCKDLPFVQKDSNLSHMSTTNTATKASKHLEDGSHAPVMAQNYHPTVKSIDLMRRLIRLVTRPDHVVLDPFMGSGTTGVAAILEGRRFIGIEREPKYFKIASTRIQSALDVYEGRATFEELAGAKEPKAA